MRPQLFPPVHYPEVAPLSPLFGAYAFNRFGVLIEQEEGALPFHELTRRFIEEIQSLRGMIFRYLDPFVLSRQRPVPHSQKLTRNLLLQELAVYSPDMRPVPHQTYSVWLKRGFIRHEEFGTPEPDSAAALLILRSLLAHQKRFLPERTDGEQQWLCYVQTAPDAPIAHLPIGAIGSLPPGALCWTPWPGAVWREGWKLIGGDNAPLGCIRFAGTKRERGALWWSVPFAELKNWDRFGVLRLYHEHTGYPATQLQDLTNVLLNQLALSRLFWRYDEAEQ